MGAVSKDSLRNRATNPTKLPGEDCEEYDFEDVVTDHLDKHVYKLAENADAGKPTIGLLSRILDIAPYVIIGKDGYDFSRKYMHKWFLTSYKKKRRLVGLLVAEGEDRFNYFVFIIINNSIL